MSHLIWQFATDQGIERSGIKSFWTANNGICIVAMGKP